MQEYYLAIDIGASSGRHIIGSLSGGRIYIEEVYRFNNGINRRNGRLCWDLDKIFTEIIQGLKECKSRGIVPVSMGIDTWAVDFVLLDEADQVLGDTYAYRDSRTEGMDNEVEAILPFGRLYERTGIQKQLFNTIYQLMAIKQQNPDYMKRASEFLMIPDYLHYLLTGAKFNEYTNATTTGLVNAEAREWDYELISSLGYNKDMFLPLSLPGTPAGYFKPDIARKAGFNCEVVMPATHDTASAVVSVPASGDDFLYISSGTWSLMGVERNRPDCSIYSMEHNFTNEGGYGYRFRYIKNIMGLWMIQEIRRISGNKYSFDELCRMAQANEDFPSRVDVNSSGFFSPENMADEIKSYCRNTHQRVPETYGELAACIYLSLAESYAMTAGEIEANTGKHYEGIHIVGGGSNAAYLNELTAKASGKTVYAGPAEATALGNIIVQMLKAGKFASLKEARECVYHSFDIKQVRP